MKQLHWIWKFQKQVKLHLWVQLQRGNYEIVAKAVSGKEVDVAQSDNSLKVNDDKRSCSCGY